MSDPGLTVTPFTDVPAFAAEIEPVLAANPVRCSVLATLLAQHRDNPRPEDTWIAVHDGGRPIAAALATRERNLLVTPLPPALAEAGTELLARFAHARALGLRSVRAQDGDTAGFARHWQKLTGVHPGPERAEGVYEIRQPPPVPDGVPGAARTAREADVPGLSVWMAEFLAEVEEDTNLGDPEAAVRRRMRFGWKFVWEDGGELVSMAGVTKPAVGVSRVGAVYTPPRFRGHGYASAVVATVTRQGFADGASACMLYTDLCNPTSNRIYRALGYRRIGNASVIQFD